MKIKRIAFLSYVLIPVAFAVLCSFKAPNSSVESVLVYSADPEEDEELMQELQLLADNLEIYVNSPTTPEEVKMAFFTPAVVLINLVGRAVVFTAQAARVTPVVTRTLTPAVQAAGGVYNLVTTLFGNFTSLAASQNYSEEMESYKMHRLN